MSDDRYYKSILDKAYINIRRDNDETRKRFEVVIHGTNEVQLDYAELEALRDLVNELLKQYKADQTENSQTEWSENGET